MPPAKRKKADKNNLLLVGGVILVVLLALILNQSASRDNPFSFLGAAVAPSSSPKTPNCVLEEQAKIEAEEKWTAAEQAYGAAVTAADNAEADKAYADAVQNEKFDNLIVAFEAKKAAQQALDDAEASGDEDLIEQKNAELYTAIDALAAADEEYIQAFKVFEAAIATLKTAYQNQDAAGKAVNNAKDALEIAEKAYDDCVAANGG